MVSIFVGHQFTHTPRGVISRTSISGFSARVLERLKSYKPRKTGRAISWMQVIARMLLRLPEIFLARQDGYSDTYMLRWQDVIKRLNSRWSQSVWENATERAPRFFPVSLLECPNIGRWNWLLPPDFASSAFRFDSLANRSRQPAVQALVKV